MAQGKVKVRYRVLRGVQVDEVGRYLQVGDRKYRQGEFIPTSELAGALRLGQLIDQGIIEVVKEDAT